MSNSIRQQYNATHTSKRLSFGIHENAVLKEVVAGQKKKDDGSIGTLHLFLTFTTKNADGTLDAEREFGLLPLRHDSKFDLETAVMQEIEKLSEILQCYYPADQADAMFSEVAFAALGIKTTNDIAKILGKKANMDKFNKIMRETFVTAVTPLIGIDSQYAFRLKVTYSKDGKYTELPRREFIEPMSVPVSNSQLAFSDYDMKAKAEAIKAVTADAGVPKGMVPGVAAVPGAVMPPAAPGAPAVPGSPAVAPVPAAAAPVAAAPAPVASPAPAPVATPAAVEAPVAATPAPVPTDEPTVDQIPGAPFNAVPAAPAEAEGVADGGNPLGEIPGMS